MPTPVLSFKQIYFPSCEIRGSHSGTVAESAVLECDAVLLGEQLPRFDRPQGLRLPVLNSQLLLHS